ncbi:LPS-assembly protein LptD [Flavobacterium sp. CBA20B-1]|uniref:putative LPS assembly protein LptD n=1 Tax=unclassified Flavobacterium TaxID=196869 RepID=UPI002225310A|nr:MULTISPECIES: putative LPS assembly protein LptD [unclassified Flavobacterium]WCM43044.1 LPS-assembly protein LptD [Flavobacterium sp. CBA20B-1]
MQRKVLYIVFSLLVIPAAISTALAQDFPHTNKRLNIENKKDTLTKTTPPITVLDTVRKSSAPPKQGQKLEAPMFRTAKDYEKLDQKNKKVTLYNQAVFKYQDYELTAGIIIYDYDKEEVYAGRIKDSLGNLVQHPVFKQGNQVVEPDSIRFNTKTKRAIVWNTRTKYNDFNVKAAKTKKVSDSVYFMKDVIFTTAEDIDNPEYYFQTRQAKFVPNKKIVTGLTNLVIEDVPTPIGLPFAFFPLSQKASSGFIIPSFGDTNLRGYFLQNGGYYFAFNDYVDLTLLGDYYTKGTFAINAQSQYRKRYQYNGNFNIRYENIVESERGLPDYLNAKIYNIQWSHSQDAKANPTSRFSASVNLGSSSYFRNSLNTQNIGSNMNNTLQSSVSYSKTFQSTPQINYTISANHTQNTNTQAITMSLPNVQASMDRVYPFAPKSGSKKGFIQNINLQYNLSGRNQIQTTDSLFFKSEMFNEMDAGIQHTIPLATNFKVLKYLSVSLTGNYTETWVLNTFNRFYSLETNQRETARVNGFDSYRTYNFSTNIGTTVYGTFNFNKNSKIQAIRHVMRPAVSYSYTPAFKQYYDTYAIDALGTTMEEYSRFQGTLFGAPNQTMSNIMSFSLGNNFEAKVRDEESATGEPKKVMLLNSLNFGTSYNFTADSLKLQPIRMNANTNLLKDKLRLNFGANLDPLAIDNAGNRIDKFNIANGGSLLRLTSANITVNYSLASTDPIFGGAPKPDDEDLDQNVQNGGRGDDLFGQSIDLADRQKSMFDENKRKETKTSFYNTDIPWDLTLAWSLTYNNARRTSEISNNSLMVSGNVTLSPGWVAGVSTGYDFKNKGVTYTQLRFERDLKSWRMDFSWIPNGYYKQWNFFIGIKSSILQDIKYEKRNAAERRFRNR